MKVKRKLSIAASVLSIFVLVIVCYAAYHHMGEDDTGNFLVVYPDKAGTKLDSCNLCHSGGSYVNSQGNTVTLGSCQWCHYKYGYDAHGNIDDTLNAYGMAYKMNGSSVAAIQAIAGQDSDGDGYTNAAEIAANRYPGDGRDNPTQVPAPYRVFTREQLEKMPQHTQFQLMNAHKSTDFYAQYTGVAMDPFLSPLILPSATGIMVYAPDGWAQFHPLYPDPNPIFYHVFGDYAPAMFYYNDQVNIATNPTYGWCDYSALSVAGRQHGDPIVNPQGLKMLLAIKRDGEYLTTGVLNPQNKLDGEGPFRIVPPQKIPGPPDQKSTSARQDVIWPFDYNADHNAGYSTRSATIIKVEPLPEGTTDIDTMEAGWPYVDTAKVVVYGSIDPVPNIEEKLLQLIDVIGQAPATAFKKPSAQRVLQKKIGVVLKQVRKGNYAGALDKLEHDILSKMDGCGMSQSNDKNDWVKDCEVQQQLNWLANEIVVLLRIVA